jgi:hypothetical protein
MRRTGKRLVGLKFKTYPKKHNLKAQVKKFKTYHFFCLKNDEYGLLFLVTEYGLE